MSVVVQSTFDPSPDCREGKSFGLDADVSDITDRSGQNIYLITNAGLTAVQFGTAPLAIGSLTPAVGPAGTAVTIHGSGFQQATTVSANGSSLAPAFVDPNTLQVIMPSTAPGAVQVTVANPAGDSYSLDNAFTAQ